MCMYVDLFFFFIAVDYPQIKFVLLYVEARDVHQLDERNQFWKGNTRKLSSSSTIDIASTVDRKEFKKKKYCYVH